MAKNAKSRSKSKWWKSGNDFSFSLLPYRAPSDSSLLPCLILWHHHHLAFAFLLRIHLGSSNHWTCITLAFLIHPLFLLLLLLLPCSLVTFASLSFQELNTNNNHITLNRIDDTLFSFPLFLPFLLHRMRHNDDNRLLWITSHSLYHLQLHSHSSPPSLYRIVMRPYHHQSLLNH